MKEKTTQGTAALFCSKKNIYFSETQSFCSLVHLWVLQSLY